MSVTMSENTIQFENMNQPTVGSDFIVILKDILDSKIKLFQLNNNREEKRISEKIGDQVGELKLDFRNINRIFPNSAVPVAGIVEYFIEKYGFKFENIEQSGLRFKQDKVTATSFLKPLNTKDNQEILSTTPLNKVWKFSSSSDVNIIVDSLVNELRKIELFETGVLDALTWSLNEVMDNVLQHSGVGHGFVMGQIHRQRKHIAFCVFDNGQGIYNSLKNSIHKPHNPIEALKIAIQENITRDKTVGQGNGMYGLDQIVRYNKGRLTIISNTALYKYENDKEVFLSNIPTISEDNGGTLVDFQLDYQNKVSIYEALIFKGKPHTNYVNYYLENLENEQGDLVYTLKDWQDGVGTRPSGKKLRNEILNNYRETKKRFIIDFANLSVISSSFADELLGKLVIEFGFFNFNNIVKLKNMNELIQQLVQRSVAQRMAESLNKNE